jgi:hypothetical protein
MLVEHVSSENERKEHATSGMRALELERICHFEALEGAKQHVTESITPSRRGSKTSSDARRVFLVGVCRVPIQTWRKHNLALGARMAAYLRREYT